MRLLIAGWQGQIAQALIDSVPARRDIEACAIGRPALDICKVGSIERALADVRPSVIINTAAYTAVDAAEDQRERAFALNRDGARLIAVVAAKRGIPIIQLSTDYVFDGKSTFPYTETDRTEPITVYGQSRLAGEAAVQEVNPKHIILRTAWVYSPFGRNFITNTLQRARDADQLRVVGDQLGSPTYAPHLAEAILAIAARVAGSNESDVPWGIYHAAGGGRASWFDVAQRILALAGPTNVPLCRITSAEYPTRAQRLSNSVLDCSKLENVFQITLPDWSEGVSLCVDRLRSQ